VILSICMPTFSRLPPSHQRKPDSPDSKSGAASLAVDAPLPQLVDITDSTGIKFDRLSSPEQKYIVESMSGGVALIDYDRDGWPDIYFTNAQSVEMALAGKKSRSALYHNNRDGAFTDVTDRAGVGYPCWAMGAAVGDYNNDGWPDLLVTCFGGVVLYRNNGDGTFTDVTKQAGLSELMGTKSNRLASNARVKVSAGDLVQTSEVLSGGSYLSQNDLRLHFGLGGRERVDKVEIFWPTGKVETLTDLAADH
jgi:ASPIC and UnbV/FG-GAP-like repeat